jgi:uncharacterized DUF497 family protein/predicted DNA binding CopG/RHH family protein
MNFTWHESKRTSNLLKHGFDFAQAELVFHGPTMTLEDERDYQGEQRFNTTGFLGIAIVTICHTETLKTIFTLFPCERRNLMKSTHFPVTSKTTSPKAPRLRVGLKDVSREEFSAALNTQLGKQRVSIMLDGSIIAFFKAKAGERGYQTLINQALYQAMTGEQIESTLRRVIREELHTA